MSDDARIRRLEEQVAYLYRHLGVSSPDASASSQDAELLALVNDGKKIHAIKRYRELTGASFEDARNVVMGL